MMFSDVIAALGGGLIGTGAMAVIRSTRKGESPDQPPMPAPVVARMIARAGAAVVIALAVGFLVAEVDSSVVDIALALLAAVAVGAVILRVARPSTRRASVGLLLIGLGGMLCAAWVGDALLNGSEPASLTGPASGADAVFTTPSPPALVTDVTGDCECGPTEDLVAIGVDSDGTIYVEAASGFVPGERIWLWFDDMPLTPIQAIAEPTGWALQVPPGSPTDFGDLVVLDDSGKLHLQVGFDPGPVAATTDAGDRVPDVGYALPGGESTPADTGATLTSEVQGAFAALPPSHWQLALILLGASSTNGTFTYELGHAREPDIAHTREIVVGDDQVAVHDDGGAARGGASLYLDRDGPGTSTSCTWTESGTIECGESTASSFAAQLRHLLEAPTQTDAVVVSSRVIDDQTAACVVVSQSPTGGPHIGEYCALPDGALAFADDRLEDALYVLIGRDTGVDSARLVAPEPS